MESFLAYVIPLVLVPLSLFFISVIARKGSDDWKHLPPGSKGWPILGEIIEFALFDPRKFVKDRMEKYSPEVFQTSFAGERVAIFCGPQGNKFLFMNDNKLVTPWWPKSVKAPLWYPEYVESDFNQVLALFHRFHDAFKLEALKQHIRVMDAMTREHMDNQWKSSSVVKILPLTKKCNFEMGCRLFLDVIDPDHVKKLFEPFALVTDAMLSVPIDLPGTAYNRGIRGGKMLRKELMRIIKERRKELMEKNETEFHDLLSKMLLVRNENGQFFSEKEVSNNIVGLLVASVDSITSAVTAVMNFLAELPHIYEEVLNEQMEIAKSKGPDELLTWEDIEKMKYSWNVVRESLRLTPPAPGAFKETTAEFTYAGFTIPKGWKALWTVHSTHMNPKYFPEPEKFDPTRFEGSGPAPYTFVPFGGGPRMCPGREFARIQVLVWMHDAVTRFRLEKAIPNEKIVMRGTPKPAHGLEVRLHPHQK